VSRIEVSDLVIPAFHDVLGDVMCHGHSHYWMHGGRGSTKSSFISVAILMVLLVHEDANAVVIRRFSNTLRDSAYEQVQWAIAELGLERYFRARVSPMELTYLPTGQRIVFRGADDPLKLKGTKFGHGYAAVVWFEELDQFDGIHPRRPWTGCSSPCFASWLVAGLGEGVLASCGPLVFGCWPYAREAACRGDTLMLAKNVS
jgi:hypothetical protein